MAASTQKCGFLRNEYTGSREYFVLRKGVLKIFQDRKSDLITSIHLTHSGEVNLLPDNVLEVRVQAPYSTEYILQGADRQDAEDWYNTLQRSIDEERQKMQWHVKRINEGSSVYKYNYSNSKRMRRHFWVSDEGDEVRWAKAKSHDDVQKVLLKDCIGMIYGPMTTTFVRCENVEDPSWCCFSLLFLGRTLDLAAHGDMIDSWFLGLQFLLGKCGSSSMATMPEGTFTYRKIQHKIMDIAHAKGLTMRTMIVKRLKELSADKSFLQGLKLAQEAAEKEAARAERKKLKGDKKAKSEAGAVSNGAAGYPAGGNGVTVSGSTPGGMSSSEVEEIKRKAVREATEQLEQALKEQTKKLKRAETSAEKAEANAKDLEQQLQASKAGGGAAMANADKSRQAEVSALKAEVDRLQAANATLEERLQDEAASRKRLDEDLRSSRDSAEREKADLQSKLESVAKEYKKLQKVNDEHQRVQKESWSKVISKMKKLQNEIIDLRSEHRAVKQDCESKMGGLTDGVGEISDCVGRLGEEVAEFKKRNKDLMEDRKKLHNMVLELKGNIRVFSRCRPMASREKQEEPKEPTISFLEDMKISVYDDGTGKRKWFEFDRVFGQLSTQREVFEEVSPLATSVLDGYNVCIFAYGQTGSGKTHTMSGPSSDPGLNTRVLTSLFEISAERKQDFDISISLFVTEIYNENIRDLLADQSAGGQKKLDVKTNPDGSNSVPGLVEVDVYNVEDVMRVMGDAAKNRSTAATEMNAESSRSHQIVTVRTRNIARDSKAEYYGKINLVDLAGSENVNKSGVQGQAMREAQNINKSLSALGDVIQALVGGGKASHIPYRNSKLTMMLKDSLGGDSKTLMIVQCSPAQENVVETMSSLNFASRARNVELGKAKKNVKQGDN